MDLELSLFPIETINKKCYIPYCKNNKIKVANTENKIWISPPQNYEVIKLVDDPIEKPNIQCEKVTSNNIAKSPQSNVNYKCDHDYSQISWQDSDIQDYFDENIEDMLPFMEQPRNFYRSRLDSNFDRKLIKFLNF